MVGCISLVRDGMTLWLAGGRDVQASNRAVGDIPPELPISPRLPAFEVWIIIVRPVDGTSGEGLALVVCHLFFSRTAGPDLTWRVSGWQP